jgi:Tol biopolymer transport system component/predicted Ser/Thr protein kinase
MTRLPAGTQLGPYEVLGPLGAGGMGEVYRAKDTNLNRDVALKILPESFAADADRVARFKREAQVLASLNHPNIAQIYGIENHALVMELVEGEDLSAIIARGAIPLADALPIAKQIADALEAAHELGVVHRDLKPANIKVRADGTVKVLDFGLAKAMDPNDPSGASAAMNSPTMTARATQMGMIIGTAAYMSPEQARGKAVDRRADIWAFGVVLYEMLTGKRAFEGEEITDVLAAVLRQDIDWAALPAATPPRLRRLLERCLDRDVKQRLRDIGEARVEIAKIESGAPDSVSTAMPAGVARRPAWRRALPWAVAGLATLVAAVNVVVPLSPQGDPGALIRFNVSPPFGASRSQQEGFELSPDGRALAFSATAADGRSRIFIRRFDQPEAQPAAGTENGVLPFWSPDSRHLGFTKEGALYRADLGDTAPRRLCAIPGPVEGSQFSTSAGTWGARGVIVFTSADGRLFQVPDSGGTPVPVTSLDASAGETIHASPSFLPDGRRVLFLALTGIATRGVIWAVAIDDPARTRITESSGGAIYSDGELFTTTAAPRSLMAQAFDPDRLTLGGAPRQVQDQLTLPSTVGRRGFSWSQNAVVVERAPQRVHQLTWVDRGGRVLGTVGPAASVAAFALAPDERRVVATITDSSSGQSDLWLFDGPRPTGTRLTFQLDTRRPLWARSADVVYFTTMPGFEQWSVKLSGAAQPEPFDNPGKFQHFEDITPAYVVVNTPTGVSIQRIGRSSERRAVVQESVNTNGPRVSPDGRWLAYSLSLPAGPEVFVQRFDRLGERRQVSTNGGSLPIWRGDGRELFFETHGGLMAVTTSERTGSLEIGPPQILFDILTQGLVGNQPHNVEVAANGQNFLVNGLVGGSGNVPLEVTLNWRAAVKK